jgi:VanZ family protein
MTMTRSEDAAAVAPVRARLLSWAPALSCMALIFCLSGIPGDRIHLPDFKFSDKVAHAIAYSALGSLLSLRHALRRRLDRSARIPVNLDVTALAVGILYGVSDEIHQLFVPLRQFDYTDMAADAVGVILGVWVCRGLMKKV